MYKNIYHGAYIPTPTESYFNSVVEILQKFGLVLKGKHSHYLGVCQSEPLFRGTIYSFHGATGGVKYNLSDFLNDYSPRLELGKSYEIKEVPYVPVNDEGVKYDQRNSFKFNINTQATPLIGYQLDPELGPLYTFGLKGSDKAFFAVEFAELHKLLPEAEPPILKGCFVVVKESLTVQQRDGSKSWRFVAGDILLVEDIPSEGIYQMFGNFFVPEYLVRLAKVQEISTKMNSIAFGASGVSFTGSGAHVLSTKLGPDELKAIRILLTQGVKLSLGGDTIGLNEYYYLHLFSGIPYNI